MLASPARFSQSTREALESPDNELFLSAASSREIAIKPELSRYGIEALGA
jgi:PIN domain nuclease of toxin-antitoxin system